MGNHSVFNYIGILNIVAWAWILIFLYILWSTLNCKWFVVFTEILAVNIWTRTWKFRCTFIDYILSLTCTHFIRDNFILDCLNWMIIVSWTWTKTSDVIFRSAPYCNALSILSKSLRWVICTWTWLSSRFITDHVHSLTLTYFMWNYSILHSIEIWSIVTWTWNIISLSILWSSLDSKWLIILSEILCIWVLSWSW